MGGERTNLQVYKNNGEISLGPIGVLKFRESRESSQYKLTLLVVVKPEKNRHNYYR